MRWEQNLYLLPEADSQMFTQTLDTSTTPHRSTLETSLSWLDAGNPRTQVLSAHEWLDLAAALLIHYSFDLSGYSASELVNRWQTQYPVNWLHLAVIEALYQGRYKAFSVQQILTFWQRRGQAIFHFNMEFERLICSKFPESLTSLASPFLSPAQENTAELPPAANSLPDSLTAASVNTPPLQLMSQEEKPLEAEEETRQTSKEKVLVSSSVKVYKSSQTRQPTYALNQTTASGRILNSQASILNKQADLSAPAVNHPPIGQFTPEKSDRSESFTSKLKAMSGETTRSAYAQKQINDENN